MKFFRYLTFLFYSYYSRGPRRNVAYLSSILGITFLIYIQILLTAVIVGLDEYLPFGGERLKVLGYIKLALFMSPIFFLLYFGIKEKNLKTLQQNLGYAQWDKEVNHRALLFAYLFLSLAALIILAIMRKN